MIHPIWLKILNFEISNNNCRALARAGNAELKRGNLKPALNWFQRSLSEYRDPELVKKAKALENQIKVCIKLIYLILISIYSSNFLQFMFFCPFLCEFQGNV